MGIFKIHIYINIKCREVPLDVFPPPPPGKFQLNQILRQIHFIHLSFPHVQHIRSLGEITAKSKNTQRN